VPRIALTRAKAAASLGMGVSSFERYVQPEVRCIRRGSLRLYPACEFVALGDRLELPAEEVDLDTEVAPDELARRLAEGLVDFAELARLAAELPRERPWALVVDEVDAPTARACPFTAAVLAAGRARASPGRLKKQGGSERARLRRATLQRAILPSSCSPGGDPREVIPWVIRLPSPPASNGPKLCTKWRRVVADCGEVGEEAGCPDRIVPDRPAHDEGQSGLHQRSQLAGQVEHPRVCADEAIPWLGMVMQR
jgi:hypothetical protein